MPHNLRSGKILNEYNGSLFAKFIAFLKKYQKYLKHILRDVFVWRVVKVAKTGLNLAVRGICCQLSDLLFANTVRRIYM